MTALIARCAAGLAGLTLSAASIGATITIDNVDAPGEGFNDPTPVSPVGGNSGTTLGQQRLIVFQGAANVWGALLDSPVEIIVRAEWDVLSCNVSGGTLGSAASTYSASNFAGAPTPDVAYPAALADSLAGMNLSGGADINARFNLAVDTGMGDMGQDCFRDPTDTNVIPGFYYGLDNAAGEFQSPLFSVVLHELGHGLGFASLTVPNGNPGAGNFNTVGALPDTFSSQILDLDLNDTWDNLSSAQRVTSATNDPSVVWDGVLANDQAQAILSPTPILQVNSPPGIAGTEAVILSDQAPEPPPAGLTDTVVLSDDGNGGAGNPNDGCERTFTNAGDINNNIALVFANTAECFPLIAAADLQDAGARAVLIANDSGGSVPFPVRNFTLTGFTFDIPVAGITQDQGDALAGAASPNATLEIDANNLQGTTLGQIRLHAPPNFEPGSSVSHWSSDASPDLLMKPNLGDIRFDQVDITVDAFADIGWNTLTDLIFGNDFGG